MPENENLNHPPCPAGLGWTQCWWRGELQEWLCCIHHPSGSQSVLILPSLPGLPQGVPGLLKVPLPNSSKSAALCYPTFLLSLWIWHCREPRRDFQTCGNHCTVPGQEPWERAGKNFVMMQRPWAGQNTSKRGLSICVVLPVSNTGSSPLTAED